MAGLFGPGAMTSQASLFAAAAKALQAMDDSDTDDEHHNDDLDQENAKNLERALEVNRTLHAALARKQQVVQETREKRDNLQLFLHGRNSEEPARKLHIEQLQAKLQGADAGGKRTAREADDFSKKALRLETRIESLNGENLQLSDRHREERTHLQEQQSRLRTLGRRERELMKQLDLITERLNQSLADKEGGCGLPYTDFRNLPGFRVDKLVFGRKDPPVSTPSTRGEKVATPRRTSAKDEKVVTPRGTSDKENLPQEEQADPPSTEPPSKIAFDLRDSNHDGVITRQELATSVIFSKEDGP